MNQYGEWAMRYWQENLPRQYAQIGNLEQFFEEMGDHIAQDVDEMTRRIAGPDQPSEGFMDKVGRLQMARIEAETEVMRQTLPQPEDEPAQPEGAAAA